MNLPFTTSPMLSRSAWLLAAALSIFPSVIQAAGPVAKGPNLDWMLGTWIIEGMNLYESWEKEGSGYKGRGYFKNGQEEKPFEDFRVVEKEGTWYYISHPVGQEEVAFVLAESGENKVVFQNKEHDFPQTITYWMEDGLRKVRLQGNQNGQDVDMTFDMKDPSAVGAPPQLPSVSPLGSYAHIAIGTKNLMENVQFYKKLGFKIVEQNNDPWPYFLLTDGALFLTLNDDGQEYFGVTYFNAGMAKVAEDLKAKGITFFMEEKTPAPMWVIVDPDTIFGIGLVAFNNPTPPYPLKSAGALGVFGEISVPVKDYEVASAWYQKVGYKSMGKQTSPYPWGIHTDGLMSIGLHQSDFFDKPTITYFSLESKAHMQRLRDAGLEVKDLKFGGSEVLNGVVVSPDGWPVNIFYGSL